MSSSPHLTIFNPDQKARNKEARFHLFPKLPSELRACIWKMHLQKNRMIHIQLIFKSFEDFIIPWDKRQVNGDGKMYGYPYDIYVEPYRPTSKLFQVCRESRDVALKFYRVHLPCRVSTNEFRAGGYSAWAPSTPGILYLNPEYDFIQFRDCASVLGWESDFVRQLKMSYDPRRIGICNLVVDREWISAYEEEKENTTDQSAFLDTISNLQEVIFLEPLPSSRTVMGYMSDLTVSDTYFNRSLPLVPYTSNFEIIGNDPRPIAEDLSRLMFPKHSRNPLETVATWRRLCQQWEVSPSSANYHILVGCPAKGDVIDRTSAQEMVEKEDRQWPESIFHKRATVEDLEKIPRPAFGFWLFPIEAFGPMTADGLSPDYEAKPDMKAEKPKDVSPYWPKLGLSDLD